MQRPESHESAEHAALLERLQALEEQLRQMRQSQARRPAAMYERLVPPEVRTHLRAAQRERLLALRAWIDVALTRAEQSSAERPRRSESVHIE